LARVLSNAVIVDQGQDSRIP